jgi:hypothetical protein
MPVAELLQRMDSHELTEWAALEQIEHREQLQAGLAREALAKLEREDG